MTQPPYNSFPPQVNDWYFPPPAPRGVAQQYKNQVKSHAYGWTVTNLVNCLNDELSNLVVNESFKVPTDKPEERASLSRRTPAYNMGAPYVYSGYIPASLLSPEGSLDNPPAPSILIQCHEGEVDLPKQTEYIVSIRLLISLWDHDPAYISWQSSFHLTEKIYLHLLKYRELQNRYEITGRCHWRMLPSHRAEYFMSLISVNYKLGQIPDSSDNVDLQLLENDHIEGKWQPGSELGYLATGPEIVSPN